MYTACRRNDYFGFSIIRDCTEGLTKQCSLLRSWEGKGHRGTVLEEGAVLLCQHCCWFLWLPSTILAGPICLQSEFHKKNSNLPRRWNAMGFKKIRKKIITLCFVSKFEIWMPDRLSHSCHSYQKPCMLKCWSGRTAWKAALLRSWGFVSTEAEMGV